MWRKDDIYDEIYENHFGKCAYLAGAMEVLTGNLDVAFYEAGVRYEALASDVFCIGADAELPINELVGERLEKVIRAEYGDERRDKLLEVARQLKLKLEPCEESMKDAIVDLYAISQWNINKVQLEEAVAKYCREVRYFLGDAQEVFLLSKESAKNAEILGEVYLWVLFDAIFIRFESHLLMFLRGSVE